MAKPQTMEMHMKYHGTKMVILGILIILNQVFKITDWATFIGVVLLLAGLFKLACCKKK